MNKFLLLTPIFLASCAILGGGATGSVQQIGKDSFTVRVLSQSSISDAKQRALGAANAHCQTQKRNVMLVNEYTGQEEGTAEKFYDLTFMCLNAGDTDFTRVKKETLIPAQNQQPAAQ